MAKTDGAGSSATMKGAWQAVTLFLLLNPLVGCHFVTGDGGAEHGVPGGDVSSAQIDKLRPGMTWHEVESILGPSLPHEGVPRYTAAGGGVYELYFLATMEVGPPQDKSQYGKVLLAVVKHDWQLGGVRYVLPRRLKGTAFGGMKLIEP